MRGEAYFAVAYEALVLNPVRAALTMLGIIIGVFSVIVMIGLGQSSEAYITDQVKGMGAGVLVVTPGNPKTQSRLSGGTTSAQTLKLPDARALQGIAGVRFVSPTAFIQTLLKVGKNSAGGQIIGTTPDIQSVRAVTVAEGRFFTEEEANSGARVIVLGDGLRADLFKNTLQSPLASKVRISGQRFRVIGVLVGNPGAALGSTDRQAYVPSTAMQAIVDTGDRLVSIMIKVDDEALLPTVRQQARAILRSRHAIRPGKDDDFKIQTQADLMQTVSLITGAFTVLLAGIAAISLLVGGIGIMNIMLVSVTERTREIGIRKAIGARTGAILRQFLIESATLSLAGGSLGIVLGLLATWGITHFAALPLVLSPWAIGGAFLFSATIGVFFGLYPAAKAARLDPVDALGYE